MIEIFLRQDIDAPEVVRNPGQLPQVHIRTGMQIEQIKKELEGKLSAAEFEKFEKLWSDDSHPREFLQEGDYLKIMDKS
jgi:hypothetical protein